VGVVTARIEDAVDAVLVADGALAAGALIEIVRQRRLVVSSASSSTVNTTMHRRRLQQAARLDATVIIK